MVAKKLIVLIERVIAPGGQGFAQLQSADGTQNAEELGDITRLGRVVFADGDSAFMSGTVDGIAGVKDHPEILKGNLLTLTQPERPHALDLLVEIFQHKTMEETEMRQGRLLVEGLLFLFLWTGEGEGISRLAGIAVVGLIFVWSWVLCRFLFLVAVSFGIGWPAHIQSLVLHANVEVFGG